MKLENSVSASAIFDIHSHILPGVDDGAENIDQSLEMARFFLAGGVGHVVATPHHIAGTAWAITADQVKNKVKVLKNVFQDQGIPLHLHAGMEIALHSHLRKELDQGILLPLGKSSSFLLEPPFHTFHKDLLDVVLSFQETGKSVILAHPERIVFFQNNIDLLLDLAGRGVKMQINLGSLLGAYGRKVKAVSLQLVQQDCIHFIASDSHGVDIRKPPDRNLWSQLDTILGPTRTKQICIENPAMLLCGC